MLVMHNALHVPTTNHNLTPPFVMREAGMQVCDAPKMQCGEPSQDDHALCFKEGDLRTPMSPHSAFSYFPTSKPTEDEMMEIDETCMLTPVVFNPNCDSHAGITDWQGEIIDQSQRARRVMSEVDEDEAVTASLQVSSTKCERIDQVVHGDTDEEPVQPEWQPIPGATNEIAIVLTSVSPICDDQSLTDRLVASV